MELEQNIEALLFYKGEPMTSGELATVLEVDIETIESVLVELKESLSSRGLVLVELDNMYELRTAPKSASALKRLQAEEISKTIGRAGSETLAIILYNSPISRSEIDYIRGVNSTFILRNLSMRGLVERTTNPKDQRSYVYSPTHELLAHLGISKIDDLPEYAKIRNELETFKLEEDATGNV